MKTNHECANGIPGRITPWVGKHAGRARRTVMLVAACLVVALMLPGCAREEPASVGMESAPTPTTKREPVILFLHGKILEEQGENAVSPEFGIYDYRGIRQRFSDAGFRVVSQIREKGTDVRPYADVVIGQVNGLIAEGYAPHQITVVGTSKGAVIASVVSTRLAQPELRYVLVAGCYDGLERDFQPRLTGHVLSLYEKSDELGGSCQSVAARSPEMTEFREMALDTGLHHGVLFRPIDAWMVPAIDWAQAKKRP